MPPPRFNVLGVGVHAVQLAQARGYLLETAQTGACGYVCFCDVNNISCAQRDPAHRETLNNALLATPDGMPLVWLGRRAGHAHTGRVYGPDLMQEICRVTTGTSLSHYFYGGGEGTATALACALRKWFPDLNVAGTHTPPFRELTDPELDRLVEHLRELKPDFIWIGLSTPKQEKLMRRLTPRLDRGVLLGVGAAFDFLSGRIRQAPRWIQRSGFEWVWRLAHEPRRLAPRYFRNNPLFVLRVAAQWSGLKKYPLGKKG